MSAFKVYCSSLMFVCIFLSCKKSDIKNHSLGIDSINKDTTTKIVTTKPDTGWQEVASLPQPRAYATGFSLNNLGYVGGGVFNVNTYGYDDMYMYDPVKNTWIKKTWLPILTYSGVGRLEPFSFVINNKIYAGGGITDGIAGKDVEEYDPVNDKWKLLTQLSYPNFFNISIATSYNNIGYIESFNSDNICFWEFDPKNNSLTEAGFSSRINILANSWLGSSTTQLLYGTSGSYADFESIDPISNEGTHFPSSYYPGVPAGNVITKNGIFYKNSMYVCFGDEGHLYRYNFKIKAWQKIISKDFNIFDGVCTFLIGSKLYIAGGNTGIVTNATNKVYAIDLDAYPE